MTFRAAFQRYESIPTLMKVFVSFTALLIFGQISNRILSAAYGTALYDLGQALFVGVSGVLAAMIAKLTLAEMFGGFGAFVMACRDQYKDFKEKLSLAKDESERLQEERLRKVRIARSVEEGEAQHPRFKLAYHAATLGGMGGYQPIRGQWGAIVAFPLIQLAYSLFGLGGLLMLCIGLLPLAYWSASIYLRFRPEALHHRVLIDAVLGMAVICLIGGSLETAYFALAFAPAAEMAAADYSRLPPELAKIAMQNAKALQEAEAEGVDIWMWAYWYLLVDHGWHRWPRPQIEAWLARRAQGIWLVLADEIPAVLGALGVGAILVVILRAVTGIPLMPSL